MFNFDLPTSATLREVEQVLLPRLRGDDSPIWECFPEENTDEFLLMWEQEDNYIGLQQVRGLGNSPPRVAKVGFKRYIQEPGVYGEFVTLDEIELTRRRRMGSFGLPVSIEDLVGKAQRQLLTRRINRIEYILWQLALNGNFTILDSNNTIIHSDGFTPQTFTATTSWSDHINSTPIQDLRSIQLLSRFQSVRLDAAATIYLNRRWVNHMIANTNQSDLGGRKLYGLSPVNNLPAINVILQGEGLPSVQVYDGNYIDDTKTGQVFIPDAKGLVIGKRTSGAPIGGFRYTMNINNPDGAPRPYMRVFDRSVDEVPGSIEVHDGFNGGPVIYFPGALVSCNL